MIAQKLKTCIIVLFFATLIVAYPAVASIKITKHMGINTYGGTILYVGGSGPGNYTKIQDAIDDANDGDIVYVFDDSSPYYERLIVNKSISLIGENRDTTVVEGNYKGTVVDVQVDGVTVSDLTLTECKKLDDFDYSPVQIIGCENTVIKNNIITLGPEPPTAPQPIAGIYLKASSNNNIQNNIIYDTTNVGLTDGIVLWDNSHFNNIEGNEIYGYTNGIYIHRLNNEDNTFYDNYIHENGDGIENRADKNTYLDNIIQNNLRDGFQNFDASNNTISGNTITNNGDGIQYHGGLTLNGGSNNQVINNQISNNYPDGFSIFSSHNNDIKNNQISDNTNRGIWLSGSENNQITNNNFINNDVNAYINENFPPFLNNEFKENYWDDYDGIDEDGDGIGDSPYIIKKWLNDDYPLMEPHTGFNPDAPSAPTITGPPSGDIGNEYDYKFRSTEPNDDDVYYYVTWGDGTYEEWNGPYTSGETVTLSHTWNKKDNYAIIARAKDTNGLIGPWEIFTVTMPRNRATNNMLLLRFLEQFPLLERFLILLIN